MFSIRSHGRSRRHRRLARRQSSRFLMAASPKPEGTTMNAIEITLMFAGFLALGWAILSPRANIFLRLAAVVLGIAALIVARILEHKHREDRR
jgi:hypothetical protein